MIKIVLDSFVYARYWNTNVFYIFLRFQVFWMIARGRNKKLFESNQRNLTGNNYTIILYIS
jgi:hypothetical protein